MIAEKLYKLLNGLICVYKPPGMSIKNFGGVVQFYLSTGFNNLRNTQVGVLTSVDRSSPEYKVVIDDDSVSKERAKMQQYEPLDFECYAVNPLAQFSSGVQVLGMGPSGLALSGKMFEENMYASMYHLTFMMGRATDSGTPDTRTVFRSSFKHVKLSKLEILLQNLVSHNLKSAFIGAGITPNSQQAFDILSRNGGFIRPKPLPIEDMQEYENTVKPSGFIYSMKCIDFEPPFFSVETQVAGEDMDFFINMMNSVSAQLKTGLVLTKCRRVTQGNFNAKQCLVLSQLKYLIAEELDHHIQYCEEQHSFERLQLDGLQQPGDSAQFISDGEQDRPIKCRMDTVLFEKPQRTLEIE